MWIGSSDWGSRACAALLGSLVALASCGGGTDQIEPFVPRQIIVLGDESAALAPDGKSSSINRVDANNAVDCNGLPMWTHLLVANFGMTLDRCNPNNVAALGVTRGAPGAKAADLAAQIDAQFAASAPSPKDLFVLMVGANDIIDLFENFPGAKDCNPDPDRDRTTPLEAELRARGMQVAEQINRLAAADTRVIVATVPDLGLSPYATTRGANALLTCLTGAFNSGLRVTILQEGRFIGLVLADDLTQAMARFPGSFSISNATDAVCTTPAPNCTTSTLTANTNEATHLWSDDRHIGPRAHNLLASFAITRARNNPF
jgi:outer membrane lipase/esterase